MSKAEDLALEKYPRRSVLVVPARGGGYYADSHLREGFIEGYHQAEKDLELTWEDINRIEIIIKDVYRDYPHGIEAKQFGVEVLNRFNKQKGK